MGGLKPLYRIYLIIAIIAAAIAIGLQLLLQQSLLPYRIRLQSAEAMSLKWEDWRYYFPRLNDRYPYYRILVVNEKKNGLSYTKIYNPDELVDQFNLQHHINLDPPFYYDYNADGSQDVLMFSHDDEWLYLSIIDALKGEFLVKEHPILPADPRKTRQEWDMAFLLPQITDLENDGKKELLFNVTTGYARSPRCFCALSLSDLKIKQRFDHHMGQSNFEVLDTDNDGKKEILLYGYASNNFPPDAYLSDAFSWVVVLDHRFRLLKEPRKVGGKFTGPSVHALPGSSGLSALVIYLSPIKGKSSFEILEKHFKTVRKLSTPFRVNSCLVDTSNQQIKFLMTTSDSRLVELDKNLNIIREFQLTFSPDIWLSGFLDIPEREERLIIARSAEGLFLMDFEGRLQARLLIKEIRQAKFLPPEENGFPLLNVNTKSERKFFRLRPTPAYQWSQWSWLPVFLLVFTLLTGAHWLVNRILQYVSFFLYSLLASNNAIILLDHRGRIISFNRKVKEMLSLSSQLKKRRLFLEALSPRNQVIETIQESIDEGKKNRRNYSFEEADKSFIGEITVTPFRSYLRFINAYLVEIKDSTRAVLLERQQNWQRNIRRIVHDLKTPLAGVQLKLQAIYMNLTENNPDVDKSIFESLETAHQELIRIRNITKDFLKFSDLQQIHPQRVRLQDIITQSLQPFKLYFTESLTIDLQLEENLPEWVNWDSRQIEILLHIILENSLDALAGNGKIEFQVSFVQNDGKDPSGLLIFKIIDNGPGIPEEIQEKIFEPHFSTKQEGSGLGLTFAKHIVQSHGGSIHFTSRPTAGTIFVIELPVDALNFIRKDI
ncbi:MAG: hypothetical protein Kow0037_15140 [Calditrichia bacterium]